MDFVDFEAFTDTTHDPPPEPRPEQPLLPADHFAAVLLQLLHTLLKHPDAAPRAAGLGLAVRLLRAATPAVPDHTLKTLVLSIEASDAGIGAYIDPGPNGVLARKSFRTQAEADLIRCHGAVLADLAPAVARIRQIGVEVGRVQLHVCESRAALERALAASGAVLAELAALSQQRAMLRLKKSLLQSFKNLYTLNEYDAHLLRLGEIGDDYCAALARAEAIAERCKLLLALDNPQLGQSILESTTAAIGKARAHVAAHCSRVLALLHLQSARSSVATLRAGLQYLQAHGDYAAVTGKFVASRGAAMVADFQAQCGEAPAPALAARPVFYSFHDPVRFVADLLAYLHAAVVNEAETLASLLDEALTEEVVAHLAPPFQAELVQLVLALNHLATLGKVHAHLALYAVMFERVPHTLLLRGAMAHAARQIELKVLMVVELRLEVAAGLSQVQLLLGADLQPPDWISEFYSDVLPLLDPPQATVLGMPRESHARFVACLVRPVAIFEDHLARSLVEKHNRIVFRLNVLDAVLSRIMPHSVLNDEVIALNVTVQQLAAHLTETHFHKLLAACALDDLYTVTNMVCPLEDLFFDALVYLAITENAFFSREQIGTVDERVQQVVPGALLDVQQALLRVNSPVVAQDVCSRCCLAFATFYMRFRAIVEEHLEPLLTWLGEEVATLLGVEQQYQDFVEKLGS